MKLKPTPEHNDKIILVDKSEQKVWLNDPNAIDDTFPSGKDGEGNFSDTWQLIYELDPGAEDSDIEYIRATWSNELEAWVQVDE